MVFQEYNKVALKKPIECFERLFSSVEFWNEYAYVVDCTLVESALRCVLILKHRVLEIR